MGVKRLWTLWWRSARPRSRRTGKRRTGEGKHLKKQKTGEGKHSNPRAVFKADVKTSGWRLQYDLVSSDLFTWEIYTFGHQCHWRALNPTTEIYSTFEKCIINHGCNQQDWSVFSLRLFTSSSLSGRWVELSVFTLWRVASAFKILNQHISSKAVFYIKKTLLVRDKQ